MQYFECLRSCGREKEREREREKKKKIMRP